MNRINIKLEFLDNELSHHGMICKAIGLALLMKCEVQLVHEEVVLHINPMSSIGECCKTWRKIIKENL